jgi:hypothetical protein
MLVGVPLSKKEKKMTKKILLQKNKAPGIMFQNSRQLLQILGQ